MSDFALGRHAAQTATTNIRLGCQADGSWNIYAGDRNAESFQYVDADGTPIDITGFTFAAQARQTSQSETALTATCTVTDAAEGRFLVEWPGEDVRSLLGIADSWRGLWDLQALPPGDALPTTMLPRKVMTAYNDIAR